MSTLSCRGGCGDGCEEGVDGTVGEGLYILVFVPLRMLIVELVEVEYARKLSMQSEHIV